VIRNLIRDNDMRLSFTALAASLALTFSANAATIVNGGFDADPAPASFATIGAGGSGISGWTVGGDSVDLIGGYWQPQNGTNSIDLAGNQNGSISQALSTIVGQAYKVTFWVARNPDGGSNPRTGFIGWNGNNSLFSFNNSTTSAANMGWEQRSFIFGATGASTILSFASDPATSGGAFGAALDNVSIAAVPEPATWMMLILGFGLVGGAMRRRKPVAAIA
jgi:choice-of-anchor C domain-containing protein